MRPGTSIRALLVLPLLFLVHGCTQVEAWERGTLAKPEMQLEPDSLAATLDAHVYFSKEASSGGNRASGGGCGCN